MSGKSYTMREMKAIVDYLTENRAYGEIKGRRMWMDYANSKFTTRTWQSLKETFVKRILPDITNPYYKLTVEQIASFRQGTDLESRINNKLEIQTVHGDSSNDSEKNDPLPSNAKNTNGDKNAGEDSNNQIRSSTDTVILEPCYNTAEEIQKDLESPSNKNRNKNSSPVPCSTKSIRDYITYSEPLTPMLQEVLHDFASEDEGDEPQMQIVEYPEPSKNHDNGSENNDRIERNEDADKNNEDADKNNDQSGNGNSAGNTVNKNVLQESDKSDDVQCVEDSEEITETTTHRDDAAADVAVSGATKNIDEKNNQSTKSQNTSSSIVDTLPNNQEAYKEIAKNSEKVSEKDLNSLSMNGNKNNSRKRSKSKEITPDPTSKKRICTDKTREQNTSDQDVTADDKSTATKLNSKNSNTEVKGLAKSNGKTNNHNPKDPIDPQDENAENQEQRQNDEICDSVCISDDNLPEIAPEGEDIAIKTDEASSVSEDRCSSRTRKETRASNKISKKQIESTGNDKEVTNDIVILRSNSESTSDDIIIPPKKRKASLRAAQKIHRDRALANVFGFSGGVKSHHKKNKKNIKRLSSHKRVINTSTSDEWTSDTGSEFISPPRGRKNKHARKYLKPKSARILSLEEEGGLFVMYGKKIYPVVKDGKLMKNYLTYTPDNDSEDEESYWKLKYVDEKRKTEELTKLLKDHKRRESVPVVVNEEPEPKETICEKPVIEQPKEAVKDNCIPFPHSDVKEPQKKDQPTESNVLKIQFVKDDKKVQVEGYWCHIQPVLAEVVHMLDKAPLPPPLPPPAAPEPLSPTTHKDGHHTPQSSVNLDDDVKEKVDKIEDEIFQKIQERDMAESTREDTSDTHVTKRRVGRPRVSSTSRKTRTKSTSELDKRQSRTDGDASVVTRQSRTPKKNEIEKIKQVATRKKSTRQLSRNSALEDEDSSIKYMLPSPRKTAAKRTKRKSPIKTGRIFSSPEDISINSIESSQGYLDTDESNLSIGLRKKRKLSLTVLNRGRTAYQRVFRRKRQPNVHEDISSDSNLSYVTAPMKAASEQSSSLNTEVYRSESYQLLLPQRQNSIQHLERIEEKSPTIDNLNKSDEASDLPTEKSSINAFDNNSLSPAFVKYSQDVTLPLSPVLSIVEKLSISKNDLNNTRDIDVPEEATQTMLNDYMAADVDMSVPLMEQQCDLKETRNDEMECNFSINVHETSQKLSETLLTKVGAVNIAEPTLSDSIHQKLKNLLLESAKKIASQINKNNVEGKDKEIATSQPEKQTKTRAKKRCSTPRKRQSKRNSKSNTGDLHVEDECIESCGHEKSHPPPKLIVTDVDKTNNDVTNEVNDEIPNRLRKKKDVIKVKILKPKTRKKGYSSDNAVQVESKLQADSGINDMESGVFLRGLEDSVDLIHNHSDTCLQAHECVSDSVEIIADNAMSVISLSSNSAPQKKMRSASLSTEHKLTDICCENAQDAANLYTETEISSPRVNSKENSCIFKSPTSNISPVNSLLTDDLSDEVSNQNTSQNRASKWFLLSEDEASNTNNIDVPSNVRSISGYGANLQELFPITCAVPDLSTITEENTMKFVCDGNTMSRSQFDSKSLPNV